MRKIEKLGFKKFKHPVFDSLLNELNKLLEETPVNEDVLSKMGQEIGCKELVKAPITEEGIYWWGLHFVTPIGQIVVLFPWRVPGGLLERPLVVFVRQEIDFSEIEEILRTIKIYLSFIKSAEKIKISMPVCG